MEIPNLCSWGLHLKDKFTLLLSKNSKKEVNKKKFPCLEEEDTSGHSLMPLNVLWEVLKS